MHLGFGPLLRPWNRHFPFAFFAYEPLTLSVFSFSAIAGFSCRLRALLAVDLLPRASKAGLQGEVWSFLHLQPELHQAADGLPTCGISQRHNHPASRAAFAQDPGRPRFTPRHDISAASIRSPSGPSM